MGAKLTKAKRGKRRWIGLSLSPEYTSRSILEQTLQTIGKEINILKPIRLYDFTPPTEDGNNGRAIIVIGLEFSSVLRNFLSIRTEFGIESLTTSGKIRLVRERLGLKKPKKQQ
jgi:hypothetical protein